MSKTIEYASFTIWGELEYGDGPLFWDGEKWSNGVGVESWIDEDVAQYEFIHCQEDLENIKSIRLEKSITYEGEPDIDDVVLEEKVISE